MQPPEPWAPLSAHCAGYGVRASTASLSLRPCSELDPSMESSPVNSPGVSSILVGGMREWAAWSVLQCSASVPAFDLFRFPMGQLWAVLQHHSILLCTWFPRRQTVSPDDLDAERRASGCASRGGGGRVLPVTGRNVTAVLEPQFQGAGVSSSPGGSSS